MFQKIYKLITKTFSAGQYTMSDANLTNKIYF